MSDTIRRWECPECGRAVFTPDLPHRDDGPLCPGVPVERTYVAVELLVDLLAGAEDMRCYVSPYFAEKWEHDGYLDRARAAIAAVTEKKEPE